MDDVLRRRQIWLVCLGLALATAAVYGQLWKASFVGYDDPDYITANLHIAGGLTWNGLVWALTSGYAANWHPLTWLSHMLDVQLFGLNPAGHHLTSVAIHVANAILLFLLLLRLTKELWPSAMVAALFALHPLHVESVAWISERKDVLSTFFGILSIWMYARWVETSAAGTPRAGKWHVWSIILFGLGLMAKPMLVTLPFVLLLLDYWPLRRGLVGWAGLWAEKRGFFVLAAVSGVVTYLVQHQVGAVVQLNAMPLRARLANISVSYLGYLAKIFWPAHLAISYPFVRLSIWGVAGSMVVLLLVSWLVWWRGRAQPWLAVGWLWFLGTLVPVIGLVQVGLQSMADRYTYIPSIGLFMAVVWTVRQWSNRLWLPALAILCALGGLSARQVSYWKNSGTLFQHAIENTKGNFVAYSGLGSYEMTEGLTNQAIHDFETAERINPDYALVWANLGKVFLKQGRSGEALDQLEKAVALDPSLADAHYDLGYVLLDKDRVGEALDQFQAQVNLEPEDFKAQFNMGMVLAHNGLAQDSIVFLQKAAAIDPRDAEAHYLLGNAFYQSGHTREAMDQYERAVQLSPNNYQARNDLAWIMACDSDANFRNGPKAVDLALSADQLSGGRDPVVLGTLAAAYAEAGKFAEAVAASRRARLAALARNNNALAELLEKRARLYQTGSPWREPAPNPK